MSKANRRRRHLATVRYALGLPRSGDMFSTMFTAGRLSSLKRRVASAWSDISHRPDPWIWSPR